MADPSTSLPLQPSSIKTAYSKISKYIHKTPLMTCDTLNRIASSADPSTWLAEGPPKNLSLNGNDTSPPPPKFNLYFKCENFQKIGAFKARGAFHALTRLIEERGIESVRKTGVVTHSSGNHAQALALAASVFHVPAYIVMPSISTPSKIAGTRLYTDNVMFSGSTSVEREAVVHQVIKDTGAVLIPPYDHPDIVLGQGTTALEMEMQYRELVGDDSSFDAVIAPIGGGGLLGGVATWFSESPGTKVFGAEPQFQGADDARRGLAQGKRIEHVKTLTIADGLRTPVGVVNWEIVSDPKKLEGIYSVSEEEIKMAMRLVYERMKIVVEPSAVVTLAVVLFNAEFREMVKKQLKAEGKTEWNVGVVLSGGNTTMTAIGALFGEHAIQRKLSTSQQRSEGKLGLDGKKVAEDVAG